MSIIWHIKRWLGFRIRPPQKQLNFIDIARISNKNWEKNQMQIDNIMKAECELLTGIPWSNGKE